MFYVLNFADHTFQGFMFPKEVTKFVTREIALGSKKDNFEIVNASDDEARMSVDEFYNLWG